MTRITSGRLARADRPDIAWQRCDGTGPTLVFLTGYASDMAGSKATALFDHAAARGRAALLFDYAGCGQSGGDFAEETLASWLGDALAVIDALTAGPLLVIGSSMGGWLMLHVALTRADRVAGLIGIAAAPDFTEWDFDDGRRAMLMRDGCLLEPNPYGPEPTLYTLPMWQSGQSLRLLEGEIGFDGPVALIHGQADEDVPWSLALRIAERLRSSCVEVHLVKDGDHRLSREADIALLLATVDRMLDGITT